MDDQAEGFLGLGGYGIGKRSGLGLKTLNFQFAIRCEMGILLRTRPYIL